MMRRPVIPLLVVLVSLACSACHPSAPPAAAMPADVSATGATPSPSIDHRSHPEHRRKALDQLQRRLDDAKRSLELSYPPGDREPR